ncbi:hypothetical protein IQ06DRAFT_101450 [Phaeosphaeriaceae sp. SRC1lsM3a]|nr:hypothetical protein IQ06DRAFT_101450 [Stagonospora sp. SRC1lsM3a]
MGDRLLYGHLPQRCIRVLTVHATSRPETPIQGNLSVVTLESCSHLQFSALSYVWGEPGSQSHHILCNDIAVPVQPNLHSALHNLRATLGTFTIWIDALCINQEDEKEKEHQIPLMGEIYAESECVYVWLGTGNFQTKRAINFLRDPPLLGHFSLWNSRVELRHWVVLMAMMTYLLEGFRLKKALFPRYSSRKSDLTSKSMTRASIHDLSTLLDAEWLERMWTYQEILLASNPILVSGQEHLPWWPFSLSITFLEYSGCFNQSGIVSYAPLTGWYKIALARDYLRYIRPAGGRTHLFHERSPEDAPLSSYIKFIQTLVHFERKLVKICVVIPITSMLFLSIIVGLIGVTDWENYRRAQKNMEFAATYNNCISSMIEAILTAYTHTARAMLTAESPTTTGTPTVVSTTTSMATPIATNVLDLLDRLHESPLMKPTKLMGTALSEISPTVVSVVQSCQSGCLQGSITQGCFTSCIAGATAMPTLRTIAFEDADVIAHMPLSSYRARFWGVFIYVSVFMGFGLLALLLGEFRRGVSIRPISQPSETAIDLVDALLYRKCRLDHDKLFALRNVLQRLSRMHSPPPDYKRSLAKVFSELNMQLSEAMNCNQMLVIASIIPLKNHPSWMVDWSQKPDPFWLSGRGSSIRDIVSNHYLEKRNESSMPVLRTKRLGKKLRCQVSQVRPIPSQIQFQHRLYYS